MSKSPTQTGTNTTTTTNAPPQYVQDAQKALLSLGLNLNAPFVGSAPNYALAGFNPDQQMAFDLARYQGQQAFTTNPIDLSSYGSYTASPASASPAANISAANLGPAAQTQAANATAAQLNGADISNFFNPYQTDVVNTTMQQLEEANARQQAAIRARQAAESAYGGNRGALQASEQNRNFGNTLASTIAGLNQSGWNNAANLGMGNTQLRQQTGLSNQAAQNQANLANQNAFNQFMQLQAQMQQQAAMQNAANQQQANMANAGYAQQANMFNAQQPLAAASLQNQLNQTSWQQQMQALQALLGTGGQQQQFAQQAINVPFTALNNLASIVPSQYGTSGTSSQPIYGPSTLQTIGALAPAAIAGAGALFSDKTMKKDMEKMGMDPKTNLDMYKYRFKGMPADSPKMMGPMAQDVEKRYPGSTERIGGKMAIKGSARTILGI